MAEAVQVSGVTTVKVGTGSAGALETLGYTRDGVHVSLDGYWLDVPGDQNGGEAGPPIEVQFMGETARVRIELTKWDSVIAPRIACRVKGATAGTPATPGTLMFSSGSYVRLCLVNANAPQNFPLAIPRSAIEVNKGTKYATLVMEFECHKDPATGTFYNATTTG